MLRRLLGHYVTGYRQENHRSVSWTYKALLFVTMYRPALEIFHFLIPLVGQLLFISPVLKRPESKTDL
jgi:hypothetical protein